MLSESLIYTVSRVLPAALSFVTGMALTWLLAPAAYGVYGLGTAIMTVIASGFFAWHGLSFMRFYQANTANPRYMPTVVASFVLLCLLTALLTAPLGLSGLLPRDYQDLIWICVPGAWCYSWFELAVRIETARFHPLRVFWMNFARSLGILILTLAVAWLTQSPLLVLAASFVAMLAAGVALNSGGLGWRPGLFERETVSRLFVFGWPIAIVQVIASSSFAIDRFLLEIFSGKAEVGYYTVAYALAQTSIATLGTGIDSAVYSRAVQAMEQGDQEALRRQLARGCTMLVGLVTPAAVGIAMVAPGLARLLVDPDYVVPVTSLIAWLAIGALIFNIRANYVDRAFYLGNATRRLTTVVVVASVINVVADFILIPPYGAVGCAIASIIAAAVGLAYAIWSARNVLHLPLPKRDLAAVLAATGLMALFLALYYGDSDVLSLMIQVVGGAAVYGAVVLAADVMGIRSRLLEKLRLAIG